VFVAISDSMFFDEMKKQRMFVEELDRRISSYLGWDASVKLVEPGAFDHGIRIKDLRGIS
jgi:phenylacetate-CoA ligase